MKKLFMLAMAAGIVFGAASCAKDVTGDIDGGNGGEKAGIRVAFALPNGGFGTRATDYEPLESTKAESNVSEVSVFVFDASGNAVDVGAWQNVPLGDFKAAQDQVGGIYYEMEDGETLEVSAGDDMRVWVGINLPDALDKIWVSEAQMKQQIALISDMDNDNNFTMFSSAPADPSGIDLTAGDPVEEIAVAVDRVVSKVVATVNPEFTAESSVVWTSIVNEGLTEAEATVTHTPSHWFIIQDANSSWVAPHYDVLAWNRLPLPVNGRPETYKGPLRTVAPYNDGVHYTGINVYEESLNKGYVEMPATTPQNDEALAAVSGRYIGENASLVENGQNVAKNGNTTYAMIATTVNLNAEVVWENEKITWKSASAYGNGVSDVFIIRYEGIEYFTSSVDNANDIQTGIAVKAATAMGITIGTDDGEVDIEDFLEDYPQYSAEIFKYDDGYVHFLVWLNWIDTNNYDILRNQFVHMDIAGLNANKNIDGSFPGYPGLDQDTDNDGVKDPGKEDERFGPKYPGDPTNINDPNNPDPKDPPIVIEPLPADIQVNITVRDWTYRYNRVELGR